MNIREYSAEQDGLALGRIWREIGWAESAEDEEAARIFVNGGPALVAEVDGAAEALAASVTGVIQYLDQDLPLAIVSAVGVSRVVRKQGLASQLTARLVAQQALSGAAVAALGIFEQGFYDRLGFGALAYAHRCRFDPAHLRVPVQARPPSRLTTDDGERFYRAAQKSLRGHGGCRVDTPAFFQAEFMWARDGFGLGYLDEHGEISHGMWLTGKGEHGPLSVHLVTYQTPQHFLELMALLANLGDQVRSISIREPAWIQIQDLLRQPFQRQMVGEKGEYATGTRALAYQQARILDLDKCLKCTQLPGVELRFNLHLTDPIADFLGADPIWPGLGGKYVISLGAQSTAEMGADSALPILQASVGAFTRLWMGVRPATGLAATDALAGESELLAALDGALRLPRPDEGLTF